jgi:hypothetical protein
MCIARLLCHVVCNINRLDPTRKKGWCARPNSNWQPADSKSISGVLPKVTNTCQIFMNIRVAGLFGPWDTPLQRAAAAGLQKVKIVGLHGPGKRRRSGRQAETVNFADRFGRLWPQGCAFDHRGKRRSQAHGASRNRIGGDFHRQFFGYSVCTNEGGASPMRWTKPAKRGSDRRGSNGGNAVSENSLSSRSR